MSDGISVAEFPVLLRAAIRGTQGEFARQMGVSDAYVSLLLSGKKAPSARILSHFGLRREVRLVPAGEAA